MGEYQNGHAPLNEVVTAFTEFERTATEQLSVEQLHSLADMITVARHDRHGQRGQTRETVMTTGRDGNTIYNETITPSTSAEEGDK